MGDRRDDKWFFEENRRLWDEWTKIHTEGDFYDVESFRNGERGVRIQPWEQAEVGDVRGSSLLHLQCHFGLDTLSWARLGAVVTGVDFSEQGIRAARALAKDVGLEARFILSSVYELPDVLDEEFDVVYASRGALGWLPSIDRWAEVVVRHLKPGGFVYVHEGHPVLWTLDDEQQQSNPVRLAYDYWEGDVITSPVQGSYADREARVESKVEHGWNHSLGEIVSALTTRGLHLEFLHEHDFVSWPVPFLIPDGERRYVWPADQTGRLPLMYSLMATRPRTPTRTPRRTTIQGFSRS